nr:SAM-dependent methyltransferase [Dermatophilus congolensis]
MLSRHTRKVTITPDFEDVYRNDPDPWDVATSWYERRRTQLILAMLRQERYGLVWDAACGTGHLARELMGRAQRLVCTDIAGRACALAAAQVQQADACSTVCVVERSGLPQVPSALGGRVPDLVVLSEVLYYLDADERAATWEMLDRLCGPCTDIVAVHWAPRPEDSHLSGAAVQRELNAFLGQRGWWRLVTHTDMEFVAVLWSQDAPQSIGR